MQAYGHGLVKSARLSERLRRLRPFAVSPAPLRASRLRRADVRHDTHSDGLRQKTLWRYRLHTDGDGPTTPGRCPATGHSVGVPHQGPIPVCRLAMTRRDIDGIRYFRAARIRTLLACTHLCVSTVYRGEAGASPKSDPAASSSLQTSSRGAAGTTGKLHTHQSSYGLF